jgi:RimJ/RimL family protein N-acetyltransferase
VLGSTRYMEIRAAHLGLEIGYTWYRRDAWGTAANPEAKLLLLAHAFEASGAERVEFKTDHRNERSQGAIARLGAVREGVFRHHRRRPDGSWRDSVCLSILREEWPGVRSGLEQRLSVAAG